MTLITMNDYVLLEEIEDKSSQFSSKSNSDNKYKVFACDGAYLKVGAVVYVLDTRGKIKIDGKEYVVADKIDVVGYVA